MCIPERKWNIKTERKNFFSLSFEFFSPRSNIDLFVAQWLNTDLFVNKIADRNPRPPNFFLLFFFLYKS